MWTRMRIGTDARAIGLIGVPVDVALMVVRNEHRPLRARQLAHAPLRRPRGIESDLTAALAISIGTRVDGIRQHMINGNVAGVDPAHATARADPHRERQALRA